MSDTEEERTIADDTVITMYTICGDVVKKVAKIILEKCIPGASVLDLCKQGDELLESEIKKVYRKEKNVKRGIAFPLCICVNNCINHFSPSSEEEDVKLAKGDIIKIDLAAHIDGLIATMAYTKIVGLSTGEKVTGRKADVILAAHYAMNAAINMMKPDGNNYQVTDAVNKVADFFQCKPIEGLLSFQIHQNRIDGEKTIVQNPSEAFRKEIKQQTFETNEVYGLDVVVSTGAGKGRELETKITIYKKTDEVYSLKLKASKEFYAKVSKQFDCMPFNMRYVDEEKKARMGLKECVSHKLIDAYPVLYEKPNEYVAQFKNTILLKTNPINITDVEFDTSIYESVHKIEDSDIEKLVTREKKKKKKSSKKVDKPEGDKENKSSESGNKAKTPKKEKQLKEKNVKDDKSEKKVEESPDSAGKKKKEKKKSDKPAGTKKEPAQ